MKRWLIATAVYATNFHLFQWYGSQDCSSAPDVCYVFQVSHRRKFKQAPNETWPPLMPVAAPWYPSRSCGNQKMDMSDGCCTSLQPPEDVWNIESATTADFDTLPADQSKFPKEMNGNVYCVLSGALNYTELYVGTAGFCIENSLKCTRSGILEIYPEANCSGIPLSITLNSSPSLQRDVQLGSFTAQLRRINSANVVFGWTEYIDLKVTTIVNFTPLEIFATFCYVVIYILELGLLFYFGFRFIRTRTKSLLLHIATHFLWLVFVSANIHYTYHRWGEYQPYARSLIVRSFFYALANAMTAISTTYFIVVFWKFSRKRTTVLCTTVALIHIGLLGGRYLYAAGFPMDLSADSDFRFQNFIVYWTNKISYLWVIFLFIYDLLPIVYLAGSSIAYMGHEFTTTQKLITYLKIDKISTALFCSQILIIAGYFVNEHIRANTSLLGNDHNHQASASFSIWFIAIHSVFNTIVMFRIARNIKFGSYFSSGGNKVMSV